LYHLRFLLDDGQRTNDTLSTTMRNSESYATMPSSEFSENTALRRVSVEPPYEETSRSPTVHRSSISKRERSSRRSGRHQGRGGVGKLHTWKGKDNRSYINKRRHPYPGSKGHQGLHAVVSLAKCIIIPRLQHIKVPVMLKHVAQELDASIHWEEGHSHMRLVLHGDTSCAPDTRRSHRHVSPSA
jgi:hypothetical protein